jgi:hypothetical protein
MPGFGVLSLLGMPREAIKLGSLFVVPERTCPAKW